MSVTEAQVIGLINAVLDGRVGQGVTEPLIGRVVAVPDTSRYLLATIGGSSVPVPVWRPSLPDLPREGDRITIVRGPEGYLVVGAVLDRDAEAYVPPDPDAEHSHDDLAPAADLAEHVASDRHLVSYVTPNTMAVDDGRWSRIGAGIIPERYGSVAFGIELGGQGSNGTTWARGWVRGRIRQQADFGTDPTVDVELVNGADIDAADIVAVVTSNAGPTTFEVHVRLDREYEWLVWVPTWTSRIHGADFDWTGCQPFEASLPAGTQTAAAAF